MKIDPLINIHLFVLSVQLMEFCFLFSVIPNSFYLYMCLCNRRWSSPWRSQNLLFPNRIIASSTACKSIIGDGIHQKRFYASSWNLPVIYKRNGENFIECKGFVSNCKLLMIPTIYKEKVTPIRESIKKALELQEILEFESFLMVFEGCLVVIILHRLVGKW